MELALRRPADDALWARVARFARCADSGLGPDEWFPVSFDAARARHEAAAAIAVCAGCPVRAQCLELSLRHWDIGQHGVWGGLIAADRARLRRQWPPTAAADGTQHPGQSCGCRFAGCLCAWRSAGGAQ
jgi:WhiB family transcriptional regulator, redox-sensing transcriptional regulator